MQRNWLILGAAVLLAIIALAWSRFGITNGLLHTESLSTQRQPEQPSATSSVAAPIGSVAPATSSDAAPISPASSASSSTWTTYTNAQYGYQVNYPTHWYFNDAGGLSDLPLKYPSRQLVNWYITNKLHDNDWVMVNVGLYDKPATTSTRTWILNGYEGESGASQPPLGYPNASTTVVQSRDNIPSGTLTTAFAKATKKEVGVLTYTEAKQGDLSVYEVGAVGIYGLLSYTRYITSDSLPYVYAIDIDLPFQYVDVESYQTIFNQLVGSFKIL